ncbi:hypothetical protein HMPREF1982_03523 [Clostridiales bacterium oral taxon 876 str. F0540]|nr:hypothetical protein HMPREF1982_03523 [Clostridiales bacterium oral taxon 876 str. F0540]
MENLLTKLMIYSVVGTLAIAFIKIGSFYLLHRLTKEKAYQNISKEKLKALKDKKVKQQLELEDILLRKEVEPYYLQAKNLFNNAMKSGNLTREQILYLEKIISESLGEYAHDYMTRHYKNNCHKIYSMLMSSHLSIDDFKRIIQLVKSFEAQGEGLYLTVIDEKELTK